MKRLNKISDKTWQAIIAYDYQNTLRTKIFYDIMFSDGECSDRIETPLGFTLDVHIEPIEDDVCASVTYTVHLTDDDGNETKTFEIYTEIPSVGCCSGTAIDGFIDGDIRHIFHKIKNYELYGDEKNNDLPF